MRWTSLGTAAAALTVRVRRQRQVARLAPVSAPVAALAHGGARPSVVKSDSK